MPHPNYPWLNLTPEDGHYTFGYYDRCPWDAETRLHLALRIPQQERLFDAAPNTPDGDRLEVLVTLVEAYEAQHYPIPAPDPVEAMNYYVESRRLSL